MSITVNRTDSLRQLFSVSFGSTDLDVLVDADSDLITIKLPGGSDVLASYIYRYGPWNGTTAAQQQTVSNLIESAARVYVGGDQTAQTFVVNSTQVAATLFDVTFSGTTADGIALTERLEVIIDDDAGTVVVRTPGGPSLFQQTYSLDAQAAISAFDQALLIGFIDDLTAVALGATG